MNKMNSNDDSDSETFVMDNKPIITCAGDSKLWGGLDDALTTAIPQEAIEWRRPLGRPTRSVHVGASFVPFSTSALPHDGNWDLIRQPILHIYWTECPDIEAYKNTVKEELESWIKELNQRNINDWMIVVVETIDAKRENKLLPRTTVLDKIRADFATKQGDRCLSVINPMRAEFNSAESWRGLVARIRILLLQAYSRALTQLEDHIRDQREKRNQPSWNFCQYFLLQEELALVLEMLGLYDEALVQYDELDALFTQFVVNSHMGETVEWLSRFQKPIEQWRQPILGRPLTREDRSAVLANGPAPLLEFRSYLYSRQAAMLLLLFKPWEVAQRCLPFLHTTVREIDMLDVTIPTGALPCWLFLACLEVLHTCEKYNDSEQVKAYSLYTADLWAYAREKLQILGELCGLLPGSEPTSEQLHLVVILSAGMKDCPGTADNPTPTDKLKGALRSKEAYNKHYLEIAELAMGIYKHINRRRQARMVGRELATFYLSQGNTLNAIVFLTDLLKMFEEEKWRDLAAQTQLELSSCYNKESDRERYIASCIAIASSPELELLVRNFYFDEMCKSMKSLPNLNDEVYLSVKFADTFKILKIAIKGESEVVMQNSVVTIEFLLESNFPREVWCNLAELFIYPETDPKIKLRTHCSNTDMIKRDRTMVELKISERFDRTQNKQISSAIVACKETEKELQETQPENDPKKDALIPLSNSNISLKPGLNTIKIKWKVDDPGWYRLYSLTLLVEKMKFTSPPISPPIGFNVVRQEPVIRLDKISPDLVSGYEQYLELTLKNGSYIIEDNSWIKLRSTKGLQIQIESKTEPLVREINLVLPKINRFESVSFQLRVYCDLIAKKDDKYIEHKMEIKNSWSENEQIVPLFFTPLFKSIWRLHTAQVRKFIQITIIGLSLCEVQLTDPDLQCDGIKMKNLNLMKGQPLVVSNGLNVSFMWEMEIDDNEKAEALKMQFTINFSVIKEKDLDVETGPITPYKFNFDVTNYKTLFVVRSSVEPTKRNEFCRSGIMCQLRLSVSRVNYAYQGSLMYEVLADQSMWAVCGRTAGVLALENDDPQTVTLDVMPLTSGHMPLPLIRLSKYIPAETASTVRKLEPNTHPRLEPFSAGQVYNYSKSQQVHVIAPATEANVF
ncbi:trafficking protein particle complex subunit 10 isoform X2 [Chrysoperla carnea]|uniref:trafficking protein particle complex subunit 10 isoform X2 n=1 Tax=Chrysoperla carnea TaxID=189513 RepID=UPI001D06B403|nr:trafficking protein particle complex subunit 10 isoform X2 [Chrysoperla carnea]